MEIIVYKVRFLDVIGKEIAEFGFYEDEDDARRRLIEVNSMAKGPGKLEIREIKVVRSTAKVAEENGLGINEALDYYTLK